MPDSFSCVTAPLIIRVLPTELNASLSYVIALLHISCVNIVPSAILEDVIVPALISLPKIEPTCIWLELIELGPMPPLLTTFTFACKSKLNLLSVIVSSGIKIFPLTLIYDTLKSRI